MKSIEFQSTVDEKGRLIVPKQLLHEAELTAGDRVQLTCAIGCAGSRCGAFKGFVLTVCGEGVCGEDESPELTLPHELLEAAEIPVDSDLEIICGSGAVVILESDLLEDLPDDLRELFDELGIHPEVVREVMRKGAMTDGC